ATVLNPTPGSEPQTSNLWLVNIDGSGKTNLTSDRFSNLHPCWASDGTLYFISNRGGSDNIWSLNTQMQFMPKPGMAAKSGNNKPAHGEQVAENHAPAEHASQPPRASAEEQSMPEGAEH